MDKGEGDDAQRRWIREREREEKREEGEHKDRGGKGE